MAHEHRNMGGSGDGSANFCSRRDEGAYNYQILTDFTSHHQSDASMAQMRHTQSEEDRRDGGEVEHGTPCGGGANHVHQQRPQDTEADDELIHAAKGTTYLRRRNLKSHVVSNRASKSSISFQPEAS